MPNTKYEKYLKSSKQFLKQRGILLLIIFVSSLALLWGLGQGNLLNWDEAIYSQVSREMLATKDWLTLHWNFAPWFHKPPLSIWATAVFFKLFGINEFWARAGSAIAGVGLVATTYQIGKYLYGKICGILASIILLTTYQFVYASRFGTMDIIMTLFTYLAILFYFYARQKDLRWWYAVWICCGLAILTKGAAGIIAPAIIIISLIVQGDFLKQIKQKRFWIGIALFLLIIVPWHAIMLILHGHKFLDNYIGYHVMTRASIPIEGHYGNKDYYINTILTFFYGYFFLLPFSLAIALKEWFDNKKEIAVLLVAAGAVFILYSIVKTKLDWYIIPIYPSLAIFVAILFKKAIGDKKSIAFSGLIIALIPLLCSSMLKTKYILVIISLGLFFLFLTWLFIRNEIFKAIAIIIIATFVFVNAHNIRGLYKWRDHGPDAKLAKIAGQNNARKPLLIGSGLVTPTPLFYSNRPTHMVSSNADISKFTAKNNSADVIIATKEAKQLEDNYHVNYLANSDRLVYISIQSK